eukprot:gene51917-63481_t
MALAAAGRAAPGGPARVAPGSRPRTAELLANTTIITPNETELSALGDGTVRFLHDAGVATVIVTRGGDGADLHAPTADSFHQPAFPANPVDTTGAGDAFNGALAFAIAAGHDIREAVSIAAAAGALSTRKVGARDALPTPEEAENQYDYDNEEALMSTNTALRSDRTFIDADGVTIHYYVWEAAKPRAVVQLAHGLGEYAT